MSDSNRCLGPDKLLYVFIHQNLARFFIPYCEFGEKGCLLKLTSFMLCIVHRIFIYFNQDEIKTEALDSHVACMRKAEICTQFCRKTSGVTY